MKIKPWISAFRLRTLPLALASIGMGTFLAAAAGKFNALIFILCALSTVFLQILSNLAKDYGDSIHGADHRGRSGPARAVQSGSISPEAMRHALKVFVLLSLLSGVSLLYIAFGWDWKNLGAFLLLGVSAIFAAILYTAGKRPYGYAGLGDLSVLIFFGFTGVMGSYYLYTKNIDWLVTLPALSCGLFSVAVLNINNIRDISSDKAAGKKSIPVRIGRGRAVRYHWWVLFLGFALAFAYSVLNFHSYWQYLFLVTLPLLVKNAVAVNKYRDAQKLDPYLRQMALTTLIFVLSFGLGNLL